MSGIPSCIAGRYQVLAELGRGGMGVVYRVQDADRPEPLALKQLLTRNESARGQQLVSLFEREFHTLAQLSHPRVIQVYDYGIDVDGPFYTMELLDGGDLRELAPIDYRTACSLMLEVCSSLALLHSRRLVHRDITPRNVRCTRDGHAKLIDFGAMVPMGPCGHTVGTPAFIAPEVLHHLSLDARTDLFSLGATLYYALTGRPPFAARELSQLRAAWACQPPPPSQFAPDIPAALDALCASLLRIDPVQRPGNAFEVMHRLQAIAGVEHSEPLGVSAAYLATPLLVGREVPLRSFRRHMRRALHGGGSALLFESAPGLGRSRVLDACVLDAKTLGALVLRADASAGAESAFAGAHRLAEQLLQALPELARQSTDAAAVQAWLSDRALDTGLQAALERLLLGACETHALLIAVDDVQNVDEPTLALLAALALQASERRLLLALTAPTAAHAPAAQALGVLMGQCARESLSALTRVQTEALFVSVFGHVAHVALLSDRLHTISAGSPRDALALAQHLIGRGVVRYERGQWALPAELEPGDLPASAADAFAARVAALPELARRLAETQALSGRGAFRRRDYALLAPDAGPQQLDAALDALLAHEVLQGDGVSYSLAHRAFAQILTAQLTAAEQQARHLALADVYQRQPGTHPYVIVRHLLAAGRDVQALDVLRANADELARTNADDVQREDLQTLAATIEHAFERALALRRPEREVHDLRERLCLLAVPAGDELHLKVGPAWLAQLELDSGLRDYRALDPALDPGVRLGLALQAAAARYEQTPVSQRVYRVDEAIKKLGVYVVTSIVVSSRVLDTSMMRGLPELLEPFVALSPVLSALRENAIATYEATCRSRPLSAVRRWCEVYERLGSVQGDELQYVEAIRNAVALAIAMFESLYGRETAFKWLEVLDHDPHQRVHAMRIRRLTALMQGDGERAARFGQQVELLTVQTNVRQMFGTEWRTELLVSVASRDLTGVKNALDGITALAARYVGWVPRQHLAQGHFELLRGDHAAARAAFERCVAVSDPDRVDPPACLDVWIDAVAGLSQALCELDQAALAVELGERAVETCHRLGVETVWLIVARALALAEAKLGRLERAVERADEQITEYTRLGVRGSSLAVSYETRARVAIYARDADAAARYAGMALRERGVRGPSVGFAEVARLVQDARGAGIELSLAQSVVEASVLGNTRSSTENPYSESVVAALADCDSPAARAECALSLLCELAGAPSGHLYLADDDAAPVLAASLRTAPPDAVLAQFARGFFAQQLDDREMTAGLTEATHMLSLPGVAAFVDARGVEHRVLMLTCKDRGELLYVGLAVLAASNGAPPNPELLVLAAALASRLAMRDRRTKARASL